MTNVSSLDIQTTYLYLFLVGKKKRMDNFMSIHDEEHTSHVMVVCVIIAVVGSLFLLLCSWYDVAINHWIDTMLK